MARTVRKTKFERYLATQGACEAARSWLKSRKLRRLPHAWDASNRAIKRMPNGLHRGWQFWLISHMWYELRYTNSDSPAKIDRLRVLYYEYHTQRLGSTRTRATVMQAFRLLKV